MSLALPQQTVPPQDADLINQVSKGNRGALTTLYERHAGAILRFAARIVGDPEAEDVVQSTFVAIWQSACTYEPGQRPARAWIFGIAHNVLAGRRRAFARYARALGRFASGLGASHPPVVERLAVDQALAQISEPKRVVLLLFEVEGFTGPEISAMLDVPQGTVWTRLFHARAELAACLGEER